MRKHMWLDARRATRRRRKSIVAATGIIGALLAFRLWLSASAMPTGRAAMLVVAIAFAVVLIVVAVALKLLDVGGRREGRAARAHDCVMRRLRGGLGELPITVVVSGLPSKRSPLLIELRGSVGTAVLRETVLGIVRREAAGLGRDVRVVDRLEVESGAHRSAA